MAAVVIATLGTGATPARALAQAPCVLASLDAYAGLGNVGCRIGGADGVRYSGFSTSGIRGGNALLVQLDPFATTLADGRAFYGFEVRYNGVADATVATGTRTFGGYGFSAAVQALGGVGVSGGRVTQFAPTFIGASAGGGYATILFGATSDLFSSVCRLGPPPPQCGIDIPLDLAPQFAPIGFLSSTYLDVEGAGASVRLDAIRFGFATAAAVTTVPEPTSVALVGSGLGGLLVLGRRRRQGSRG